MTTVMDAANSALAAVNSDISLVLAAKWVSDRYQELVSRVRFRHLRQIGEVVVPGVYFAGTATATRGSREVVGSGTVWHRAMEGRYFRQKQGWYKIAQATATRLVLESEYAEEGASTTYHIAARHFPISPKARWTGTFVFPRRRRALDLIQADELQRMHVVRRLVTTGPWYAAEVGVDRESGGRLMEFYPYSEHDELIQYVYWERPRALEFQEELPLDVDEYVLKEGVLIDIMRGEMKRALDGGQLEAAALWRNDYRAQETRWEQKIMQAVRADNGPDDLVFVLDTAHTGYYDTDIMTAHDEVYSRWPL